MSCTLDPRRRRLAALAAAVALAPSLGAQPEDPAVFRGRERVTAIDLVVEFEPKPGHEWRTDRKVPKDLRPEDFELRYGGEVRPLVAVEEVGGLETPDGEPWRIVLYFDAVLTSTRGIRRMASALYERLDELTAAGTVELVWADALRPASRVAATRETALLRPALSEVALTGEGRDELLTLRYQLLRELAKPEDGDAPEMSPAELVGRVAEEEARIVRRRLDTLLTYLTAPSPNADAGAETSRRAVFLVNDGFDLQPEDFYGGLGDELDDPPPPADVDLASAAENLARTLAAYGWATFSLALPPPPPPPRGVRLGKWLFTPARPERRDPDPRYHIVDPADRHTERRDLKTFWTFIGGIRGSYQERRDPERAQAYLDLGRSLVGQDRIADAEDAFRRAVYHYADDPKWAPKQAEALIELGRLLERRGEQEARHAFAEAYLLDPGLAAAQLGPPASFSDPTAPLALLARSTAGWVIQDGGELDRALATLGHRVRLTYQVSGPPDGGLHPVRLESQRQGFRIHAPGWARSATPDTVAAARARELLRAPYRVWPALRGDLYLDARPAAGGTALDLRLGPPATWKDDGQGPAWLRVTLGFGGPETEEPRIEHRVFREASVEPRPWTSRLEIDPPDLDGEPGFLAVLVEDLDSGSWGARLIDLAGE